MLIPLILLSIVGIYNGVNGGVTAQPPNARVRNLPSAQRWVVYLMWNFMGWELPRSRSESSTQAHLPTGHGCLVLIGRQRHYATPPLAGLYGGAGGEEAATTCGGRKKERAKAFGVVMVTTALRKEPGRNGARTPSSSSAGIPDIATRHARKPLATQRFPGAFPGAVGHFAASSVYRSCSTAMDWAAPVPSPWMRIGMIHLPGQR
jgi:hypothetical protein